MTARLDDVAARATAEALAAALDELERLPDSQARSLGLEAVDALLQLHGEGLARVFAAHRDGGISDALFSGDEVVSQLLAVHGLVRMPAPATEHFVPLQRRRGAAVVPMHSAEPPMSPVTHTPCELCAEPIGADHRHLVDVEERRLLCACRACAILFDRTEVGGRYRLVPRRYRALDPAGLESGWWDRLHLPVDIAFVLVNSKTGLPVASFPGPMGTTESEAPLPSWNELATADPLLGTMAPDVEAVLVRRVRGARDYWLVPVDECYTLAGIMRSTWQGISGGDEMRHAVDSFFERLALRDRRVAAVPSPTDEPTTEATCRII